MTPLLFALLVQGQVVQTTGYVDSRTTGAWTQFDGAPGLTELVEGNVQLKLTPHELLKLVTDTSLFWQGAWLVHGGERELPNYRPTVVVSELYADVPLQEHFRLVVGKKRIVWGPGLAFNPTDVLNPPKDPTDPTFQRAGAWLAEAEWGFEKVALSAVIATRATQQFAGLPTALVYDPVDRVDRWAFTARLYLLLADIDINVIYAFTNQYNDAFTNKSRVGLTASRVFGSLELHAEAMVYSGSSRITVNGDCVSTPALCVFRGTPLAERRELDGTYVNAQALVGGRYQFDSGAFISLEYYFNGEGQPYGDFKNLATLALANPALAQQAIVGTVDPGTPQKFTLNAFRRHYAAAQVSVPQLWDDWTLGGAAIIGLEDLSMQLVPQVQWMPWEWLQLTLAAYVPIAGLKSEGVEVDGTHYGQFTLSPFQTRLMFQARAFF